jgi:hypothetical protein
MERCGNKSVSESLHGIRLSQDQAWLLAARLLSKF